ncbi:hypothetical protein BKA80DRAFT_259282 [Phyllosticta citrichinensis]
MVVVVMVVWMVLSRAEGWTAQRRPDTSGRRFCREAEWATGRVVEVIIIHWLLRARSAICHVWSVQLRPLPWARSIARTQQDCLRSSDGPIPLCDCRLFCVSARPSVTYSR